MRGVLLSGLILALGACDSSSGATKDAATSDRATDQSMLEAATTDGGKDAVASDGVAGDAGAAGCSAQCHGSTANAAPPLSVSGLSATTERAVGAHQAHLKSSTWHVDVQCADCHLVPSQVTDTGHIDTALPAEVTFSAAARADGAGPAWSGTSCSGVYCHGATLSGGAATGPTWTKVDGSQATCGACHGLPPTQGHTSSTACATCHGAVVDASMKIIAPSLHIDGKVSASGGGHATGYASGAVHGPDFLKDPTSCTACHGTDLSGGSGKSCETCHSGWKTKCTFCHGGTDNATGAPPETVGGKTATTVPGVGRHTSHVSAGATHAAFGCSLCHKVPQSALSPGHIDPSPAEVTFGGLAAGSTYSFSTNLCSNVYCHGNGKSSSSGGSALWVGSLSGGCSACHDDESGGSNMTLSGEHKKHIIDKNLKCSTCHNCVVNGSKMITDPTKHVNGQRDICGSMNLSWNAANKSCTPPCHGTEVW